MSQSTPTFRNRSLGRHQYQPKSNDLVAKYKQRFTIFNRPVWNKDNSIEYKDPVPEGDANRKMLDGSWVPDWRNWNGEQRTLIAAWNSDTSMRYNDPPPAVWEKKWDTWVPNWREVGGSTKNNNEKPLWNDDITIRYNDEATDATAQSQWPRRRYGNNFQKRYLEDREVELSWRSMLREQQTLPPSKLQQPEWKGPTVDPAVFDTPSNYWHKNNMQRQIESNVTLMAWQGSLRR